MISLLFAWYDLWIGAYYCRATRTLYVLPIPCVGVRVRLDMLKVRHGVVLGYWIGALWGIVCMSLWRGCS